MKLVKRLFQLFSIAPNLSNLQRILIATLYHFKQPVGRLVASIFKHLPSREHQYRKFFVCGTFKGLGIQVSGQMEYKFSGYAEHLKPNNRKLSPPIKR
jgi:hypothetical protein